MSMVANWSPPSVLAAIYERNPTPAVLKIDLARLADGKILSSAAHFSTKNSTPDCWTSSLPCISSTATRALEATSVLIPVTPTQYSCSPFVDCPFSTHGLTWLDPRMHSRL
ncbi:hypothetical protein Hypma_001695 [Hypsizygus marmoreus]|uniref:Uncharacterized protein n=1 Tax=Hypsizygus marmoreus TaxID=39966 RepID=A0A369J9R2_HYPMA|nr:hypothetical protein Hypma_001695 [Hypsizygus marmoreus]